MITRTSGITLAFISAIQRLSAPRAEPPREALDKRDGNARVTISTHLLEKFRAKAKKLLHRLLNALMSRPPNFARACGRVPVGGHPDKRPDSRPE